MAKKSNTVEIKIKLVLKKLLLEEYEAIMKNWKRHALKFEKDLRHLADNGVISFKILDDFTKKFKFDELHRLRFTSPEEPEIMAQRPGLPVTQPVAPQYTSEQFNQPQTAYNQPTSFGQPTTFPAQPLAPQNEFSSTPRPQEQPAQTGFASSPRPNQGFPTFTQNPTPTQPSAPGPLSDLNNQPPTSPQIQPAATAPQPTTSPTLNFNVPGLSPQPSSPSASVSLGADEEDRATGIAILRKKMLTELRKIRSVVEQEGQDDSF